GNYQFQVTVSVKNTNQTNSIDASLYIVTVENGVMNIVHGGANTNIGVITPMDILNSKTENATYASYGDIIDINGGNFFDSLKDFGSRVWKGIKRIAPYVKKGFQVASKIAPYVAPLLGLGEQEQMAGTAVGGELVGGKMIRREKLRDRLRKL